jgi:hypothetical protein
MDGVTRAGAGGRLALLATVLLLGLGLGAGTPPASAQVVVCGAPAQNCATAAGVRTCTEIWSYTIARNPTLSSATGAATSCQQTITGTVLTFIARRPTAAAATGGCNFGGTFMNGAATFNYTCTIDQASGLPVELLDFAVDEPVAEGEGSDAAESKARVGTSEEKD